MTETKAKGAVNVARPAPVARILSLCSGIGGLELGAARVLGELGASPRVVCYVEREAYAASVLAARMASGDLDSAPVWSNLNTFDAGAWRGAVDIVLAGYPCQPFSVAGARRGVEDHRHLWPRVLSVLEKCRAPLLFVENVPGHVSQGLDAVLRDLDRVGFSAEWDIYSAEEEGAAHRRERLFLLAYAHGQREPQQTRSLPEVGRWPGDRCWRPSRPAEMRAIHGISCRVDRLRGLANAVVSACARRALLELWGRAFGGAE